MHQPTDNLIAEKQEVKPFYVYIHRRADDGRVFYVGKGTKRRAWQKHKRSKFWQNVATKHGFTVEITRRFKYEHCALVFEEITRQAMTCEPLVNLVKCGFGGMSWDKIGRTYTTKNGAPFGFQNPERRYASISKIKNKEPKRLNKNVTIKSTRETKTRSEAQSGKNNPRYDPTKYKFYHKEKGCIELSKYEFKVVSGVAKENVRTLVNGKRKTAFGWICLGKCPVS